MFLCRGIITQTVVKVLRIESNQASLKNQGLYTKRYFRSFQPVGCRPGILYGLRKNHKKTCNGLLPFLPILSAIGIPTYKLANILLKFLTPSAAN